MSRQMDFGGYRIQNASSWRESNCSGTCMYIQCDRMALAVFTVWKSSLRLTGVPVSGFPLHFCTVPPHWWGVERIWVWPESDALVLVVVAFVFCFCSAVEPCASTLSKRLSRVKQVHKGRLVCINNMATVFSVVIFLVVAVHGYPSSTCLEQNGQQIKIQGRTQIRWVILPYSALA